ncbi:MAG TPA: hypothetical protein VD789_02180 [Thermomicrobiales bacterium]|nr:hypothetical protein [Thermomicrobiales bacterium]
MAANKTESTLSISAPGRRALVDRLCDALNDVLAGSSGAGSVLLPWQATAATFADLPREIVTSVLAALEDESAHRGAVELGGYMETDQGSRAWGTVSPRAGKRDVGVWIDPETIDVREDHAGWRLEATVRSSVSTGGHTDA